jgi:isopentenyl-diphosphate Delta-isomerase
MEHVILVDEHDREVGTMEKMEAHRKGVLHRAFSVLIFNSKGELLLQKRALTKYHSGGLWTNTCCSHPLPGESIPEAAQRKLKQEMGIACPLTFSHKFIYQVRLDNQLIEHECDSVLIGHYDGAPAINRLEAEDWKYVSMDEVKTDALKNPEKYTYWFRLMLQQPELPAT